MCEVWSCIIRLLPWEDSKWKAEKSGSTRRGASVGGEGCGEEEQEKLHTKLFFHVRCVLFWMMFDVALE